MPTDIQVDPTVKVTFGFERKKSLADYNSATASAFASADIPVDADQSLYVAKLQELAAAVKAVVFEELGVDTFLDESGVLREIVAPTATQSAATKVTKSFNADEATDGDIVVANFKSTSQQPLPGWLISDAKSKGVTAVYDNRDTATGKQPHFKETKQSADRNGRDKELAFWPPR